MSSCTFQDQERATSSTSEEEKNDLFDRLPDHVVLLIFNKVLDAQSLCLSMSVCKRFCSIIPEIETAFLSLCKEYNQNQQNPIAGKSHDAKKSRENILDEALKSFRRIKNLELNLPFVSTAIDSNLLTWKAEFGSQLHNCLVLCATEITKIEESHEIFSDDNNADGECLSESPPGISDNEIKTRIIWIFICLILAASRRRLFKETLKDKHPHLHNLIITDQRRSGTLSMNQEQIQEFKKSRDTEWPALSINMRYVEVLKVSRYVMKGATLVVIKPVEEAEDSGDWRVEAFDSKGNKETVFDEAVREMLKKKIIYSENMTSSFEAHLKAMGVL